MYQKRRAIENLLVMCFDLLALGVSFAGAVFLRYKTLNMTAAEGNQSQQFIIMIILYIALHMVTNYYSDFFRRSPLQEFASVLKEEILFYTFLVVVYFLIHSTLMLSRLMIFYLAVLQTILTFAFRLLLKQYLIRIYRFGRFSKRLVLVTVSDWAETVIEKIKKSQDWMNFLSGVVLLDGESPEGTATKCPKGGTAESGSPGRETAEGETAKQVTVGSKIAAGGTTEGKTAKHEILSIPVVADRAGMLDYIVHHNVDEVFFCCPDPEKDPELRDYISELQMMGILVDINLEIFDLVPYGNRTINRVGGYEVASFARNVISTRGAILKRVMDILGSLVGMVLFGVVAIFAVPAIRLDSPGPAIFKQTRVGKNGRRFQLYKFRSMYQDAEERKKDLMDQNEVSGLMFKIEDDPRITRVGRFLRRTSLDELPQFWNVLKGDMSLVGTRPPTVDEFEQYSSTHKARLSMTPGLTGIWQISGRSEIRDFDEVVAMDMEYIDNWSIGLDIKILLKTIPAVLKRKGSE